MLFIIFPKLSSKQIFIYIKEIKFFTIATFFDLYLNKIFFYFLFRDIVFYSNQKKLEMDKIDYLMTGHLK